jgi:hypothetical protein
MTKLSPAPCPVCAYALPAPKRRGGTVYTYCPTCRKHYRAKFWENLDGVIQYCYVARKNAGMVVFSLRVPAELKARLDKMADEKIRESLDKIAGQDL